MTEMRLSATCGHLILGGFHGTTLPESYAGALRAGERAGAILFRRNLPVPERDASAASIVAALSELPARIHAAAPDPAIIAVDQEGGRVARIGRPILPLPAAARLGATLDEAFVERVAHVQGTGLRRLGFTTSFAPVLDVHTRPENPIIGDRAFGTTPEVVTKMALAFARGLRSAGIFPCGKHFPGHGDTTKDSHVELPVVHGDRAQLEAVELAPFAAAARAGIEALMTAHVVYPALDDKPATLSRAVCTDMLRHRIGFRGVLVSDDLEMQAVAARAPVEELAVEAVSAGCDLLLICSNEDAQTRAHTALVRHAEAHASFRERCEEAAGRVLSLRRQYPSLPQQDALETCQLLGSEVCRDAWEQMVTRGLSS